MAPASLTSWLENLPIRSRVNMLVLGVMLPVAALVAAVLANEGHRAEVAAQEKVGILANETAADLQRMLRQFESVLASVSARPQVKAVDPAGCDPLVDALVHLNSASVGFAILDGRGRVVCQGAWAPVALPVSYAADGGPPDFPRNGLRAGSLFVDPRSDRKLAALSYPVRDGKGSQAGLLVMTVDLLKLSEQMLGSLPKDAVVTVVDRTRTVLLRSTDAATFIGTRPAAQEPGLAPAARDGAARMVSFATLPDVDWRVAASLPVAEVFAGFNGATWRIVGFVVGLCLFAFGLAWRMGAGIAGPIARLQEAVGQMAAGKGAPRAMVAGPPEIRAVAEQFNQIFEARVRSDARLRGILESVVDAILTTDEHQVIVQANPAAGSMFRCAVADMVGTPLARFIPDRYRLAYWREIRDFAQRPVVPRRTGLRREVTAMRADGMVFPVEASLSNVSMAGPALFTVILRDVTERRRAEQALRDGASKLEAALSSMSDAVCISDAEGRLVEFNLAFATFHGFADKAACSTTLAEYPEFLDMLMPDGGVAPQAQWPLSRALQGETASNCEYHLRRRDSGKTWIGSYSFAPIRSDSDAIVGAVMAARDVTAIRAVQADLESSHFALQRFIASRDQIQEEERKRIARELHDDLQQTLAAIRMNLRSIEDQFSGIEPGLRAPIDLVDGLAEQAVASTRRIVNDLRPPMLEDLGLLPALELLASQFGLQTGIACKVDATSAIVADLTVAPEVAICLYRVTQEALNNVTKHAHARNVRIRLATDSPASISLQVTDDGVGMDDADRRKPDSFGILGIRERVRSRDGFLRIDSAPGEGTRLQVHLSLAASPLVIDAGHGAARAGGRSREDTEGDHLDDAHTLPRLLSRTTHRALQDAIDALWGNVAILDAHGVIRFVNRAWTEFARRNGARDTNSVGLGVSYVDAWRHGSMADDVQPDIARGLEELLRGSRATLSRTYTCHSPDELRWFQMHASPMANGDVMVEHYLIRHERRGRRASTKV